MRKTLKLAVVGVGRIGVFHAMHVQELGKADGACELVAVADRYGNTAEDVARDLRKKQASEIRAFKSTRDLADAGLIDEGCRVMLEKPLTGSVEAAADFVRYLSRDNTKKQALMQAFMRRFDEPLLHAKSLLDRNAIGDPFKVVSVLEDPHPPPVGYNSPGIVPDMAVHNIDEAIWLLGALPERVGARGANLHNFRITTVKEDFDDAHLHMTFPDDVIAQVQVSRNHVAGYRNETWVYGREGLIHMGPFQEDPLRVTVEAYSREGVIEKKDFRMRDYPGEVPVFIERFGPSYKRELAYFVDRCLRDEPFSVTQEDGLNAMRVAEAGVRSLHAGAKTVAI